MKSKRRNSAASEMSLLSHRDRPRESSALREAVVVSIPTDPDQRRYNRKFYLPSTSGNALYRSNRPDLPFSVSSEAATDTHPSENVTSRDIMEKIDVDWSMRMMDKLWNASLYEFIRDEENCECTARYVSQIMKEYSVPQCVQALQWLLAPWRPEMKARCLRICFADYEPDVAGTIFGLLSHEWEFEKELTINTALILLKEPADIAAEFVVAMTKLWAPAKITELLSCLDCVLDWTEEFFQQFTAHLIENIKEQHEQAGEDHVESERLHNLLNHLSLLYEVNLAETNLRLALADYQLALAEHKLRTVTRILAGGSPTSVEESIDELTDSAVMDKSEE